MAQEVVLLGATVAQPATDYGGQFLPLTHVEQKLKTVNYRWNPNTLAYEVETVTGGGTGTDVNVTNSSIPVTFAGALPAGANTLGKVDQGVGGASAWKVDGSAATQPVSGPLTDTQLRASAVPISGALTDTQLRASAVPVSNASLPLPSGASTLAAQATGNSSLSSIDTKVPALGQALAAASVPVILPSATITTLTPPAAITGFALEAGHLAAIDSHLDVNLSTRLKPADTLAGITTVAAVTAITNPVSVAKVDLAAASPSSASVGVASGAAVAANASRKGLVLRNLSANRISLGFDGAAAVLDSGVTLYTQDAYAMGEYDFTNGAVAAIASGAASTLAIQEYS